VPDAGDISFEIVNLKDRPADLATLAQWHQNEWGYLYPESTLQDRIHKMQAYLQPGFIPSTFVACMPQLLGSAAIVAHDMEERPELTPWLASVYVAPEYRRRGIGSHLVNHVVEQANQQDIERLYLFTTDQMNFYKRLGWTSMETTDYHGIKVTIMTIDTHTTALPQETNI
jgi:GNAT superfamily N-acetyltransferase